MSLLHPPDRYHNGVVRTSILMECASFGWETVRKSALPQTGSTHHTMRVFAKSSWFETTKYTKYTKPGRVFIFDFVWFVYFVV